MQHKMMSTLLVALSCLLVSNFAAADDACAAMSAEYGIVCVCNSTYCDTAGSVPELNDGEYAVITSSKSGQRFNVTTGTTVLSEIPHRMLNRVVNSYAVFMSDYPGYVYITLDPTETFQEIQGFGGSFTDSAGMNILNISSDAQENLLKSYFGADGLDYNLVRIPIGGSDFSTRPYAYNEYPVNDTSLNNFTLSEEDYTYKIPLIKRAQELASDDILIHASAWGPPGWMKTNNNIANYGLLKPEYYHTYALYHLKFLQEYKKENISIYGLSTGNEPIVSGLNDLFSTNCINWVAEDQAEWIVNYFGPVIKGSEFPDTKLYLLDEQTPFIDDFLTILAENEGLANYTDGVAVHYYLDSKYPMSVLNKVRELFGDIPVINTEADEGIFPDDLGLKLGDWDRAEFYLKYVIENLNYNLNGWIDFNMALNMEGGPKWNGGVIDAFTIVDAENDQFYKEPMYYAFGHVSKYVPRGSVRIGYTAVNNVSSVAFQRPDGLISVVALNDDTIDKSMHVDDVSTGQYLNFTLEANSIATIVYKPKQLI